MNISKVSGKGITTKSIQVYNVKFEHCDVLRDFVPFAQF